MNECRKRYVSRHRLGSKIKNVLIAALESRYRTGCFDVRREPAAQLSGIGTCGGWFWLCWQPRQIAQSQLDALRPVESLVLQRGAIKAMAGRIISGGIGKSLRSSWRENFDFATNRLFPRAHRVIFRQ
jgi:hypothetical protein